MSKITDEVKWNLNITDNESMKINAIIDLESKEALSVHNFANEIMSNITEKWHVEDNTLWYDLNRLYIPETLLKKAKQLSHDIP